MDKHEVLSRILVLEDAVQDTFFKHYRKMAGLMGIDGYVSEEKWLFFTGVFGDIALWAIDHDSDSQKFSDKCGGDVNYMQKLYEEFLRNKLDMSPSDHEIKKHLYKMVEDLGKYYRGGGRIISGLIVPTREILLVPSEMMDVPTIAHEAGHLLYETKAYLGNRGFIGGMPVDSELFAMYSADCGLRALGLDLETYIKELEVKFDDGPRILTHQVYQSISKDHNNDLEDITGQMKQFFEEGMSAI